PTRRPDLHRVALDVRQTLRHQVEELAEPFARHRIELRVPADRRQREALAQPVLDRLLRLTEDRQEGAAELLDVGPGDALPGLERRRGGGPVLDALPLLQPLAV